VVFDGMNGLLVPAGDTEAFIGALRRYFDDAALRQRLRAAAAHSVRQYDREHVFSELEATLVRVAA
jgi:glycosyltransferase involved in cell wall biosynthesis